MMEISFVALVWTAGEAVVASHQAGLQDLLHLYTIDKRAEQKLDASEFAFKYGLGLVCGIVALGAEVV